MNDPEARTTTWSLLLAAAALLAAPPPLTAQQADYPTEPPPPLEAEDVDLPELARDTLDNGLELIVVENHELPVVSARLYVPGGAVADPEGKTGLASLTSRVLDKGTEARSASEIASTVEGVGASLDTGAADDYAFVATTTLTRHLSTVLEVFADVVMNATFPGSELETERKRMKANLQQQLSQPSALARRHFDRIVYGDHPYGDAPTPESVEAIQRKDLMRFHDERYVPEGGLLILAGDVDPEGARRAARTWLGEWSGERPEAVERPEPPSRDSARIYLVHRPGSEQSVIGIGHLGIRPGHEDAYALEVANRVLGGGANARLFLVLREEKGWTYGAYSRLTEPRGIGVFGAQAEVRNPVTDSALSEMLHQIRRLRNERVPREELNDAKSYLTGNFPLQLETPQQVASRVADVLLRGLEVDYLETYRSRVSGVTAEDVQEAAREHLHPGRAAIVVVGDATRVRDDLAEIGPVTLLDTEGEPLELADLELRRSDIAFDVGRVRTGELRYGLRARGNAIGASTMSVEAAGEGRYRVQQEVSAGGGRQRVSYVVTRDLRPVSVTRKGGMGPISTSRDLEYSGGGQVTGTATVVERSQQGGGQKRRQGRPETEDVKVDTTVAPGTIDDSMTLAAILSAPLSEGMDFRLPVFGPRRGARQLEARVTGRTELTVEAGTFEAWVVEVTTGQQPLTYYVTREPPRMLVKQEMAGGQVTLELESVGGESGGEDSGS